MKSACVGVLSIIELKNAWWNTEIQQYIVLYCWVKYCVALNSMNIIAQ